MLTRIHRAWLVAAVTFLVLIASAAFRSSVGLMIVPFEDDFGWSRSATSLAVSVNLVFYGLTAPFAAALMERVGVRRIAAGAMLLVAIGTALTTVMTQAWQLVLLWGVLVGLGTGATALVFGALIANRWFVKHRGLVIGVFGAAWATGQLVFLPFISRTIETQGWRWASLGVAALAALTIPLVWIKDWDFNWQGSYAFVEPVRLPKGSVIKLEATYDNSPDNPHNPSSPPKPVSWGEQTTDEMCLSNELPPSEGRPLLETKRLKSDLRTSGRHHLHIR